jgi:integrase
MLRTVYRKKETINGKKIIRRIYRGRYRLDGDSKVIDITLDTTDKRVAQQKLEQIIRERQMEQEGILAPSAVRQAAKSPLDQHLADYVADLHALERDERYVYELKNRVRRLIKECKWNQFKDITSSSFQGWRVAHKLAPKTLNEYLGSISSFMSWMEKHERILQNPLRNVQKVATHGKQVRPRRAFADDEMARLLAVAGPRKVVYLAAVHTGLRRSELKKAEREALRLELDCPILIARASTTKNHKQVVMALHPELVAELRVHMEKLAPKTNRIFADFMPNMDQFRADLESANIPFINEAGQRADFHSLRHTLATNLARAGTAPRVAMEIMRHSDMRLTAKTYTDVGLLPVSDAVTKLPALTAPQESRPLPRPLPLVRTGQNGTTTVRDLSSGTSPQLSEDEQTGLENDEPVTPGHKWEGMGRTGFEPVKAKPEDLQSSPVGHLGICPLKEG